MKSILDINKKPIMLAPLAGVTDKTYRSIAQKNGADIAITEMVNAKGLYYGDEKTVEFTSTLETEHNTGIQLFGNDAEIIANVIKEKINIREDISFIDFNVGCPAPKIVKNNEGSALMKDTKLLEKILKGMVNASIKPVSLKIRLGWDEESKNYLEVAKIAESAGISFICLHGRTRSMFYSGKADWSAIYNLKNSVNIPVVGNGDIFSAKDAKDLMDMTNCDGVMVARGALGNPWIFNEIKAYMNNEKWEAPTTKEKYDTIVEHYSMLKKHKGERLAVLQMRKHIAWYLTGLEGNKLIRDKINRIIDIDEILLILREFLLV